ARAGARPAGAGAAGGRRRPGARPARPGRGRNPAAMRPFFEIFALAAARKGGDGALERMLAETAARPPAAIAAIRDARILAEMTRRISYAGFSYKVVDDKWPAFEQGFAGFDPNACAFMSEEQFDALMRDRGIVRNGAKIRAVQRNARFLLDLRAEHG